MGIRIHQLPPLIANQIAAGEVIERPASVVKELLENSLDAGATIITVEIGYGGLNQIKISDNGTGIVAEDLPLAIAAHATSKITTLNDLYAIDSMGFRGEALASIASVAKVTISSRPATQDIAMMLCVAGTETTISPCARTVGTTIDVVDLFFNAPVRKRFLKSEKLEFQAIETVIKRFAISAPGVNLTLKHNGKQVLSLPAAPMEQGQLARIARIMGHSFMKDAISLDVERSGMRLQGWISGASFQRSQNDRQWVYINQRMVKDKLIHHAIKQAYEDLLYPGRFPACVLYLTIAHAEVDVNVHPTKHEVRFQQPRLVHDFFTSQLRAALVQEEQGGEEEHVYTPAAYLSSPSRAKKICEPYPQLVPLRMDMNRPDTQVSWMVLNDRYILAMIEQQPYIVDLCSLQRHGVQQHLSQQNFPFPSRPLLVPVRYPVAAHYQNILIELNQHLRQLGIHLEPLGEEVLIRTIPVSVPYLDLRLFLDGVFALDAPNLQQLIELLSSSQVFDPRLLSQEEKTALNQLLLQAYGQENKKAGLFKALTREDCQNLVQQPSEVFPNCYG